jgi:phosphoserine phosphatase
MKNELGIELSDAVISKIVIEAGQVRLHLKDWQEVGHSMVFANVLMIEDYGIVGEDVSHMSCSSSEGVVLEACRRAGEDPSAYQCFSLFGAWSDDPMLRLVALSVVSEQTNEQ